MKLRIGNYDVEVTAAYNGPSGKTRKDTMHFLNLISMYLGEAAIYNVEHGYVRKRAESEAQRLADDIYYVLEAKGLYKGL